MHDSEWVELFIEAAQLDSNSHQPWKLSSSTYVYRMLSILCMFPWQIFLTQVMALFIGQYRVS